MIAASAAWSTSVTKSFGALRVDCRRSRSSDARLMIAPAARAALMAMLSMGCSACDMGECSERGRRSERAAGALRCAADNRDFSGAAACAGRPARRFVLVGTSHAGNVGAAARAMKVMGFDDLVLVAPRFADVLQRAGGDRAWPAARSTCSQRARVVGTLAEALDGMTHVCATAMTPRDFGPPTLRAARSTSRRSPAGRTGVAFVFGSERFGMRQRRRLSLPRLPVDPDRRRLRLAQPRPGGAVDRLRVAPGAGRLCRRAAQPPTPAARRRGRGARAARSTGRRR